MLRSKLCLIAVIVLCAQVAQADSTWTIAFDLAFNPHTPFGQRFKPLTKLPYAANLAITQSVSNHVVQVAVRENRIKPGVLFYGPGGYGDDPITPSAQLTLRANDAQVRTMMDCIGYLAQQSAVIASRPVATGGSIALDIAPATSNGFRDVVVLNRFWLRIGQVAPALKQGFSPIRSAGRIGIRIIDIEGKWQVAELPKFHRVIADIGREMGMRLSTKQLRLQSILLDNDWQRHSDGAEYLKRLSQRGHKSLARRLKVRHRPAIAKIMAQAYRKHVHGEVRRASAGYRLFARRLTILPDT